jgi:hypothetical protein
MIDINPREGPPKEDSQKVKEDPNGDIKMWKIPPPQPMETPQISIPNVQNFDSRPSQDLLNRQNAHRARLDNEWISNIDDADMARFYLQHVLPKRQEAEKKKQEAEKKRQEAERKKRLLGYLQEHSMYLTPERKNFWEKHINTYNPADITDEVVNSIKKEIYKDSQPLIRDKVVQGNRKTDEHLLKNTFKLDDEQILKYYDWLEKKYKETGRPQYREASRQYMTPDRVREWINITKTEERMRKEEEARKAEEQTHKEREAEIEDISKYYNKFLEKIEEDVLESWEKIGKANEGNKVLNEPSQSYRIPGEWPQERNPLMQIRDIWEKAKNEGRGEDLTAKEVEELNRLYTSLTDEQKKVLDEESRFFEAKPQDVETPQKGFSFGVLDAGKQTDANRFEIIKKTIDRDLGHGASLDLKEELEVLNSPLGQDILLNSGFTKEQIDDYSKMVKEKIDQAEKDKPAPKTEVGVNIPLEAKYQINPDTAVNLETALGLGTDGVKLGGPNSAVKVGVSHKFANNLSPLLKGAGSTLASGASAIASAVKGAFGKAVEQRDARREAEKERRLNEFLDNSNTPFSELYKSPSVPLSKLALDWGLDARDAVGKRLSEIWSGLSSAPSKIKEHIKREPQEPFSGLVEVGKGSMRGPTTYNDIVRQVEEGHKEVERKKEEARKEVEQRAEHKLIEKLKGGALQRSSAFFKNTGEEILRQSQIEENIDKEVAAAMAAWEKMGKVNEGNKVLNEPSQSYRIPGEFDSAERDATEYRRKEAERSRRDLGVAIKRAIDPQIRTGNTYKPIERTNELRKAIERMDDGIEKQILLNMLRSLSGMKYLFR